MRCLFFVLITGVASTTWAQLDFEREPILYSKTEATDRVAMVAKQIRDRELKLSWEPDHGYLKSVLAALDIPQSSQTLVFSKTSLQVARISPQKPRAIYFNDDAYVGWVQRGDVIEVSAADPSLGGTFYSLPQRKTVDPVLRREFSRCLQCHGSTHTRRIPGHIVRSVFPDSKGLPVFRLGTHLTSGRSPFRERWGGWYVTGTHGSQRHMGNTFLGDPDAEESLDVDTGANIRDLSGMFDVTPYLTAHSDIVALLVLQHQVEIHNVLTAANHSGRLTARDAEIMNKALERDPDHESDSTRRRYESAAEKVVRALFFCDNVEFTAPIKGTSSFTEEFQNRGPFDSSMRSLRQFDLQTRLFKYPCSFLIYSEAFRALPEGVAVRVNKRLREVLSGQDTTDDFAHLSTGDRKAVQEILAATH